MISVGGIGKFGGTQFGVRGNTPDPADVTPSSGLIKYELMQADWVVADTGKSWDRASNPGSGLRGSYGEEKGTLLVQMLGDRRIKVEVFLGKAPGEVEGFTDAARIYER